MIKQIGYTAWVLGLTMAVCSALLVAVDRCAQAAIAKNGNAAVTSSIQMLVPTTVSTDDKGSYYILRDAQKAVVGYAFVCKGRGYQSELQLLCAVDAKFATITGIEVIEAAETPGLGMRIAEPWFKKQFAGLSTAGSITYTKGVITGHDQIQAISGATISTRATVNAVNEALKKVKAEVGL